MKTLIIYESVHHGNTARVARAMAEAMGARLARPDELSPSDLLDYDLIGFGSGIYFGRHHRSLRAFVKGISRMSRAAFVFSTSGAARNQNRRLIRMLTRRGFSVKADFFCPGYDTVGPLRFFGGLHRGRPNERDLDEARAFARLLVVPVRAAA